MLTGIVGKDNEVSIYWNGILRGTFGYSHWDNVHVQVSGNAVQVLGTTRVGFPIGEYYEYDENGWQITSARPLCF